MGKGEGEREAGRRGGSAGRRGNCRQNKLTPSSSSSAFDMMVALTRFFLPRVPHIWMSGANPLQTPRAWF